jgi:Flp pilus assembly protein TadG
MVLKPKTQRRTGAIVPLVAVSLIAMMGMMALAIDLGMMAIARNQCQGIADASALAAARALNGDPSTNNNSAGALAAGNAIATQNTILGQPISGGQVNITIGDYYYDPTSHLFKINATGLQPPAMNYPPDNFCLAQATISFQGTGFFSNIWSTAPYNSQATATSAHNPRDAAIVQDFSGSMRFDSWIANAGPARSQSQNPDTIYPLWGPYAALNAPSNFLQWTSDVLMSGSGVVGQCNYTTTTPDGPPLVNDYSYSSTAFGATPIAWGSGGYWNPQPSSYSTAPAGDQPAFAGGGASGTYAKTASEVIGGVGSTTTTWSLNWELDGYSGIGTNAATIAGNPTDYSNAPFYGYTIGPGYWGKTFFLWPPDPRKPWDPYYWGSGANITEIVSEFVAQLFNGGNKPVQNSPLEGIYKNNTAPNSKNWPGTTGSNEWPSDSAVASYINGLPASAFPGGVKPANLATVLVPQMQRLYNRGGKANGSVYTSPGMPQSGNHSPQPCDWRARFFFNGNQSGPMAGNNDIFTAGGDLNTPTINSTTPSASYLINYAAILDWVQNAGPSSGAGNIFPPQLRLGGMVYYSAIPSDCYPNMPWSGSGLGSTQAFDAAQASCNMAFWQTYIDGVLGLIYNGGSFSGGGLSYSLLQSQSYADLGYRTDYAWGTAAANARPSIPAYSAPASGNTPANKTNYMVYTDNPYRGNTKYWFGPLTFTDITTKFPGYSNHWNDNFCWTSGTAHEAPTFQCKLGIQGALKDMQNNHPNDMVSLQFFSTAGQFYNYSKMPLSRNYNLGVNSEWFSGKMIGNGSNFTEITPFSYTSGVSSPDCAGIPRANGSTNFEFPCELAFNQFSANSANITFTPSPAPAGTSGGLGRTGATKLLIFETDGQINQMNNQSPGSLFVVGGAAGTSYYKVRCTNYNGSGSLESTITVASSAPTISASPSTQAYPRTMGGAYDTGSAGNVEHVIEQMVNDQANNGFSTQHRPALVHCIAFGILFDPSNPGYSYGQNSLKLLHNLEVLGSTQGTAAGNGTGAFYPNSIAPTKIIYGTFQQRINNLQAAFQTIMQDAIQVTLISSNNAHTVP